MANWYVSSVAYAAITAFQTAHAYSIGDIVRPTAAAEGRKQAYRCTTAGTSGGSESAWTGTFGGTTSQGTAVFTAIGGDTYGWSAALGDTKTVSGISTVGYGALGDNIYLSSDHSESNSTSSVLAGALSGSWGTSTTQFISVSRAGSVPPVAADVTAGASITNTSGSLSVEALGPIRWQGISIIQSGAANFFFNSTEHNSHYFKDCSLQITSASSVPRFVAGNVCSVTLDNTPLTFGNAAQGIRGIGVGFDLTWINTTSAILGTLPTTLFQSDSSSGSLTSFTCRGVDLSAFTGNIYGVGTTTTGLNKLLLESCKISASATLFSGTAGGCNQFIELVNCWDGTNVLNTRVTAAGTVSTERTIVLSGGAADDVGSLSFKMVSNSSKIDKYVAPLDCFYFDVENTSTGSSKTATIEINASATLKNDEVWMRLEYMGTSGNPVASFVNSLPTTILTTSSNLSTSAATWSSDPGTPAHQSLSVTFTPQRAGRVRAQVFLGKASTTIYVNPQIAIT